MKMSWRFVTWIVVGGGQLGRAFSEIYTRRLRVWLPEWVYKKWKADQPANLQVVKFTQREYPHFIDLTKTIHLLRFSPDRMKCSLIRLRKSRITDL